MNCCFTGHRPEHLPWITNETDPRCIKLKSTLKQLIKKAVEEGFTDFYCGMARGIDMYAAEAVLEVAKIYPDIKLHAVLPCSCQDEKWNATDKKRYMKLCESAQTQTIISPFYTETCMLTRNRYMIDNSDRLIAVWNGQFRGGAAYTVRYAKKMGKEIIIIRPGDSSVKEI